MKFTKVETREFNLKDYTIKIGARKDGIEEVHEVTTQANSIRRAQAKIREYIKEHNLFEGYRIVMLDENGKETNDEETSE